MFVQGTVSRHSLFSGIPSSGDVGGPVSESTASLGPTSVRWHCIVAIATMCTLLLSATAVVSFAPIDPATPIAGAVALDFASRHIQVTNGGVIASLLVHTGDLVSRGQVIASLDERTVRSRLQTLDLSIIQDTIRIGRLEAEIAGTGGFDVHQIEGAVASEDLRGVVNYERSLFRTFLDRNSSRQREDSIQKADAADAIKGFKAQLKALLGRIAIAEGYTNRVRRLWSRQEATANKLDQAADAELELRQNAAELEDRCHQVIAKANLLAEGERASHLAEVSGLQGDLDQVRREVASDRSDAIGLRLRLEQSVIRSPCDCEVAKLIDATPGTVLSDGHVIAELYPIHPHFAGLVRLAPSEVSLIHTADVVEVRIAEGREDLRLSGRVKRISHSSSTDELGRSFYEASIEFIQPSARALQPEFRVGLPISVFPPQDSPVLARWWPLHL